MSLALQDVGAGRVLLATSGPALLTLRHIAQAPSAVEFVIWNSASGRRDEIPVRSQSEGVPAHIRCFAFSQLGDRRSPAR